MTPPFRIRFHPRARRLKLKVHRDAALEVVAPPGADERLIRSFVDANSDWVDRTRARFRARRTTGPDSGPFPEILKLRAIGRVADVRYFDDGRRSWRWESLEPGGDSAAGLTIGLPARDPEAARSTLVAALKVCAGCHLQPRFHALAARLEKSAGRLTWRNQKTRWGSCSTNGNISLNIRLLFLPPQLVDYVFAHELAHLDHPDHSSRFWNALEVMLPGARAQRKAIRDADHLVPDWI